MASIDVGIHPDAAGITSRRFVSFSTLDLDAGGTHVSIFIGPGRAVLGALYDALDEIRADMDKAAQTASDQTPMSECSWPAGTCPDHPRTAVTGASDQTPTIMADWPAGPPGELVEVFGK